MPAPHRVAGTAALLTRQAAGGGVVAGLLCVLADAVLLFAHGTLGFMNDFNVYWSAARVVNDGGNMYSDAVTRVHTAEGFPGLVGSGYSYPPIFIEAFRPLALLPPRPAAAIFGVISVIALGAGVALLMGSLPNLSWRGALVLGALAGVFPPLTGSLWVGQVNLAMLPALALAYRGVAPGLWLMVPTAVKIYPGAGLVALIGRADRIRQLGLAILAGFGLLVIPELLGAGAGGFGRRLTDNLKPDMYMTNQSLTGFLTRVSMSHGWPLTGVAVVYVDGAAILVLVIATLAVLWRCRFQPWEGSLALSLWLGTLIATRNSLWNFTPLLLVFAYSIPIVQRRPWRATGLVCGYILILLQPLVWGFTVKGGGVEASLYSDPLLSWTSSLALYGGLVIGLVCAGLLITGRPTAQTGMAEAADAAG